MTTRDSQENQDLEDFLNDTGDYRPGGTGNNMGGFGQSSGSSATDKYGKRLL